MGGLHKENQFNVGNRVLCKYADCLVPVGSSLWRFGESLTKNVKPNFWIVCRWEGGEWVGKLIVSTAGKHTYIRAGDTLIGVGRCVPDREREAAAKHFVAILNLHPVK